jgi:branched-chain amino acid transport system permease protein
VDTVINLLVQGTLTSATLALLALGFSLVYGVGGTVNLAHGSFYLLGAYGTVFAVGAGAPLWLGVLAGLALAMAAGALLDRAIKPVRHEHVTVLILTLAAALAIDAAARVFFGTANRSAPGFASGSIEILGVNVVAQRVVAGIVAVVVVAAVLLVLAKTPIGRTVRAVAEDGEAASLMGINTDRMNLGVMMLGAALAGLAGIMVAPFDVVFPGMWLFPLTQAFAITILGGLGSISGTVMAAFIVGFLDRGVAFLVPGGETLVELVTVAVILATLVLRPGGLRGVAPA